MNDHETQPACAGTGPLAHAVLLNEEIKQVIGYAAQVNMTALNANLMARRAGDRSRGFRVVATQLRVFSDQLEKNMGELAGMIFRQVREIARMFKTRHDTELYSKAHALGQGGYLDASLSAMHDRFAKACGSVSQGWRQLAVWVGMSLRLCRAGESLVWSARMEAARGGEMEPALRQVAERIAEVVAGIATSLERQRARLAELRA